MIVARLCWLAEDTAHRCGRCVIDPPSWAYDLTVGEWADFTVKPLNPGNLWWRWGQWLAGQARLWEAELAVRQFRQQLRD